MAVKSRSLRNLQSLRLETKLGPPDTQYDTLVGQSPDTPMREANPHHILSFQGLLSGTPGGTGSTNITAPNIEPGSTQPNNPFGGVDLAREAQTNIDAINRNPGAFTKPPTNQYPPDDPFNNPRKKSGKKVSLIGTGASLLGKKALGEAASKSGIAKLISLFL